MFLPLESLKKALQLAREQLVETLVQRKTSGVHTANRFTYIASALYGIRAYNENDVYTGVLADDEILNNLEREFKKKYTPYHIPTLVCNVIMSNILEHYSGPKERGQTYVLKDAQSCGDIINKIIYGKSKSKYLPFQEYFIVDEQDYLKDLNWEKIKILIFKKLYQDGYISSLSVPENIIEFIMFMLFLVKGEMELDSVASLSQEPPDILLALIEKGLISFEQLQPELRAVLIKTLSKFYLPDILFDLYILYAPNRNEAISKQLVNASKHQDFPKVKTMLQSQVGFDLSTTFKTHGFRGYTAAHFACRYNNNETLILMFEKGFNINFTFSNGPTLLDVAIDHGCISCVEVLVNHAKSLSDEQLSLFKSLCKRHMRKNENIPEEIFCLIYPFVEDDEVALSVQLLNAARFKKFERVKALLQNNIKVSWEYNNHELKGYSAAHFACKYGEVNILLLLLMKGCDLSPLCSDGPSVMSVAVLNNSVGCVEALLNYSYSLPPKERLNFHTDCAYIASCYHSSNGSVELINKYFSEQDELSEKLIKLVSNHETVAAIDLIENSVLFFKAGFKKGYSAALLACKYGNDELLSLMIEKGLDINAAYDGGPTLLATAIDCGNKSCVEVLVKNANKLKGQFKSECVKYLEGNENIDDELFYLLFPFIGYNKIKVGKLVLREIANHKFSRAKYLLENGAYFCSADTVSKKKYTAAHYACEYGNDELLSIMLEKGLDINITYDGGPTLLAVAIQNGSMSCIEVLVKHANKLKGQFKSECVKYLERDENIDDELFYLLFPFIDDAKGEMGKQLVQAVANHKYTRAKFLLEKGAEFGWHRKDSRKGYTAAHFACKHGNAVALNKLLEMGWSINSTCNGGPTLLSVAIEHGKINCVEVLINHVKKLPLESKEFFKRACIAHMRNNADVSDELFDLLLPLLLDDQEILGVLLLYATQQQNFSRAKLLLDKKVDLQFRFSRGEYKGYTAAHFACRYGDADVLDRILGSGFDLNRKFENTGISLIEVALENEQQDCINLLFSNVQGYHWTCKDSFYFDVGTFLYRNHYKNPDKVLQYVPTECHLDVLKFFIIAGKSHSQKEKNLLNIDTPILFELTGCVDDKTTHKFVFNELIWFYSLPEEKDSHSQWTRAMNKRRTERAVSVIDCLNNHTMTQVQKQQALKKIMGKDLKHLLPSPQLHFMRTQTQRDCKHKS